MGWNHQPDFDTWFLYLYIFPDSIYKFNGQLLKQTSGGGLRSAMLVWQQQRLFEERWEDGRNPAPPGMYETL